MSSQGLPCCMMEVGVSDQMGSQVHLQEARSQRSPKLRLKDSNSKSLLDGQSDAGLQSRSLWGLSANVRRCQAVCCAVPLANGSSSGSGHSDWNVPATLLVHACAEHEWPGSTHLLPVMPHKEPVQGQGLPWRSCLQQWPRRSRHCQW